MSIPIIHESSAHALAEDSQALDPKEWRREAIGLIGGLVAAIIIYLIFPQSSVELVRELKPDQEFDYNTLRITAAVAVLMGAWWMTEAIPLAATALVPLVAFPMAQVIGFGDISAPYASPTIFLFMGGFILALGMQRWNLHRRLALNVVLLVGTKPKQLIAGFMLATGFLSMWVSNTATAVVMLPIGISVLQLTADTVGGMAHQKKFATGLMLAIAYAASIGSLGTIIGTPPNALLVAYMADNHNVKIGFGQWMLVGIPLALVFMVIAWAVLITVFKPEVDHIPGGREMIRRELALMGPIRFGEGATAVIFIGAALAWVFLPLAISWTGSDIKVADAAIGLSAAMLMFIIPANPKTGVRLMDWKTANELPWDVLLLFGGGLALSKMFATSGLSLWIGELAKGFGVLPVILLIFAIAAVVLLLTEFTSNTATAATFLPIMAGVAIGIGLTASGDQNILLLTIPVALSATCAFMLPVATPPNAIAYGSGYVKIGDMIKGGIWLNVIGVVLVTLVTYFLAVPAFGLIVL
ncbi:MULTISPECIES: DASS family sodium-coupled anion symporter [unclassified Corynebacterium]|uniref:SLC13 family permease n=1 Tax=unclassified Corynebacterium TaxID=2624378 RepID=UPI0021698BEF|nr:MULTISPECIES: DASS family sodium-coupled anion symporter [unclassified Corynebacterium]MCS4492147.1 DASS family sodium-coupled anion symporter [Corynebacterium sp. ES2715-CONJ3]MCS4532369.1 DASS family sodium-coupled anion symporter [Corynebacterium sp. ES2730-CONJ]